MTILASALYELRSAELRKAAEELIFKAKSLGLVIVIGEPAVAAVNPRPTITIRSAG